MGRKIDKTGEIGYNNFGSKMTIIRYNTHHDMTVLFEDGFTRKCNYKDFKCGNVKNPYEPRVYGHGYLGETNDKYTSRNGKPSIEYKSWNHMLERCYDDKYKLKYPTYNGVICCDSWLNFSNYVPWFKCDYYEVPGERMCLDKDILCKGNKIYSPENCCFVPNNINVLFVKSNALRGELPIGVTIHKPTGKFRSQYNMFEDGKYKRKHIGLFTNVEDAFQSYKYYKELTIKKVADYYKQYIPEKVYKAMYNYEVEITD